MELDTETKSVDYKYQVAAIAGIIFLIVVGFISGKTIQKDRLLKPGFSTPMLNQATPTVTPTINPLPTPHPLDFERKEYQVMIFDKPQWVRLTSTLAGISFDYPIPEKGRLSFGYSDVGDHDSDPSGQSYRWSYEIFFDAPRLVPYTRPQAFEYSEIRGIAGGISSTFKAGRDRQILDFYQLDASTYDGAIKVFKTKYGTDAVLSSGTQIEIDDLGNTYSDPNDKSAVIKVNLPFKFNPKFKGIAIFSNRGFSMDEAQRIVSSITVK